MKNPLETVIEIFGTQSAVAKAYGLTQQAVSRWKRIPTKHALKTARLTAGQVSVDDVLGYDEYVRNVPRRRATDHIGLRKG